VAIFEPAPKTAPGAKPSPGTRFFLRLFFPLAVIYLVTTTWSPPYGVDTLTNILTAREIATEGDVYLDDYTELARRRYQGRVSWVIAVEDTAVSQYPPGAAILAVPPYAVWTGNDVVWQETVDDEYEIHFSVPAIAPAAITTALTVAAGLGFLGLALRQITSNRTAMAATYALGLGTGVWSVAADKLWLHTADVLYLGAALWFSTFAFAASGIAFGLAILTRPHTAVIALGTGLGRALDLRKWRPAVLIGVFAGLGLGALLLYNWVVFGSPTISGGYSWGASDVIARGRVGFLRNVWGAMFDIKRGLFVYSPFLILLIPGLGAGWKVAPRWARGAALGGLLYMAVQLAANRFSGGAGFLGYRYPIELLIAAAPLLTLAYTEWTAHRPLARRLFFIALIASVPIHAFGQDFCLRYGCV
jgi:hypothetical protein